MTIKQLKEILATNFVDYKGCVEKHELTERVKRLYRESNRNKDRSKYLHVYCEGMWRPGVGGGSSASVLFYQGIFLLV